MPLTHLTFRSEPQPLSLQPAALSPSLSVSPSIFSGFFPPLSLLIQGYHSSNIHHRPPFFLLIPFTDILCHRFLASLNIHQVTFNQREPLSLLSTVHSRVRVKNHRQPESLCPRDAETVHPAPVFFVVAPPGPAVCFRLIKFGM